MECGFELKNSAIENNINSIIGANHVLATDIYLSNTRVAEVATKNGVTKKVLYLNDELRNYIVKQTERLLNEALDEDILNTDEYKELQKFRINSVYEAMRYKADDDKFTSSVNINTIKYNAKTKDLINKVIAKAAIELYNDSHSSVDSLSKLKAKDSKSEKYGYTNAFERSLGVHFSALRILDIYNKIVENGNEVPKDIANTLKREISTYWADKLTPFIDFDSMSDEDYAKLRQLIENGSWNIGKVIEAYVDTSNLTINNYLSLISVY